MEPKTIDGAPQAARWHRAEPRRDLPWSALERMVSRALPQARLLAVEPLTGGLRNANFRLRVDSTDRLLMLRVYEHDASLCRKEIDLMRRIAGAVPVPEVIHAAPGGLDEIPPFTISNFVEGITFHELRRGGDREAIAQAAASVGEVLAAIGQFRFARPGWLGPGPEVTGPLLEGADPMPRFLDLCLASANLQRRMDDELRQRIHLFAWTHAPVFAKLDRESHLVHGDFNRRNLVVRAGSAGWRVAAVLDWEFAVSGTPLADLGSFLRYERAARPLLEPHVSQGYLRAGGELPVDWRRRARLIDLLAVCESLTHEELPDTAALELVELTRATVDDRDPELA